MHTWKQNSLTSCMCCEAILKSREVLLMVSHLRRADFKLYTTLLMRIQEISSIFSTWCKTSLPTKGNVDVSLYDLGWKRKLTGRKSQWNRKTGSNTNKPKLDKIGCSFNKQVRRRPRRRPFKKFTAFWGQKIWKQHLSSSSDRKSYIKGGKKRTFPVLIHVL